MHVQIIFQSDVDGGPGLTPLSDTGAEIFTGVEPPSVTFGGCSPDNPNCLHPLFITVISDTEVPEPASLLLLGSGLLVVARNRRRTRVARALSGLPPVVLLNYGRGLTGDGVRNGEI